MTPLDEWVESINWEEQHCCLLCGRQPELAKAVRAHTDIPIYVYDPGGGEPPAPGVLVYTDLDKHAEALTEHAMRGDNIAAYVSTEEEERLGKDIVEKWQESIFVTFQMAQVEKNTEAKHGERWAECVTGTIRNSVGAVLCGSANNVCGGVPVAIVGAGPSLTKNVDLLRAWRGKGLIIAAGTAVGTLTEHDVIPDMIVVSDSHPVLLDRVKGYGITEQCVLLGGLHIDPGLWELPWRDRILAVHHVSGIGAWLAKLWDSQVVPTGGCVTGLAAGVALTIGANPIVLVGQDCAFEDNGDRIQYYADGAGNGDTSKDIVIKPDMNGAMAAYHEGDADPCAPMVRLKAWSGEGTVPSALNLDHYRRWFRDFAAEVAKHEPGRVLVNATEGGAHIEGWHHLPLKNVTPQADDPWAELLSARRVSEADARNALNEIAASAHALARAASASATAHAAYVASQAAVDEAARASVLSTLASRRAVDAARTEGARNHDVNGTTATCIEAVASAARRVYGLARGDHGGE